MLVGGLIVGIVLLGIAAWALFGGGTGPSPVPTIPGAESPQATLGPTPVTTPDVVLPTPTATALTPTAVVATPTLPPVTPSPVPPTPTLLPSESPVLVTPTPLVPPSNGAGPPDDPIADQDPWPTDAATVKTWIPPDVASGCSIPDEIDDVVPDAVTEYVCSLEGVTAFKGSKISAAYYFFEYESQARVAYDSVLKTFEVGYDTDRKCPAPKGAENTWVAGSDDTPRGRFFCTLVGAAGDQQTQYFETFYGQPIVVVLYRDGKDMKPLDDLWRSDGGDLDPIASR